MFMCTCAEFLKGKHLEEKILSYWVMLWPPLLSIIKVTSKNIKMNLYYLYPLQHLVLSDLILQFCLM